MISGRLYRGCILGQQHPSVSIPFLSLLLLGISFEFKDLDSSFILHQGFMPLRSVVVIIKSEPFSTISKYLEMDWSCRCSEIPSEFIDGIDERFLIH